MKLITKKTMTTTIAIILIVIGVAMLIVPKIRYHMAAIAGPGTNQMLNELEKIPDLSKLSNNEAYQIPYAEFSVTAKEKQLLRKEILDGGQASQTNIIPLGGTAYAIGYSTWAVLPDAEVSTTWSILKDGVLTEDLTAKVECTDESCKGVVTVDGVVKNINVTKIISYPSDGQLKTLPGLEDLVILNEVPWINQQAIDRGEK